MRSWLYPIVCIFFLVVLPPPGLPIDGIVATVDDHIILFSDLKLEIMMNHPDFMQGWPGKHSIEEWQQILEQTIDRYLLYALAQTKGLNPDEQRINMIVDRQIPRLAKIISNSADHNLLETTQGQLIKDKLKQMETEKYMVSKLITSLINISEQEIRQYQDCLRKEGKPLVSYRLAQIFLKCPPDSSAQQVEAIQTKAYHIRRQLEEGGDFAALARAHSQDPSSRLYDGYLGWLDNGTFLPELERAAEKLKGSEISEPIRSSLGFHIIKLIEKLTPEEQLFAERFQEEKERLLKTLRQQADVKIKDLQPFIAMNREE